MTSLVRQRRDPVMSDALDQLEKELEDKVAEQNAKAYAQPHHREPDVGKPWSHERLSMIADMCCNLTYGEMMSMSKGLVQSLVKDKESSVNEEMMARSIHDWASNYQTVS